MPTMYGKENLWSWENACMIVFLRHSHKMMMRTISEKSFMLERHLNPL
jgi:hypothetical protein